MYPSGLLYSIVKDFNCINNHHQLLKEKEKKRKVKRA